MSPAEVPVSRVGELLADKYRIVRFLGEGGMGTVYEAYHSVVGRRFAVKFLHSELAKEAEILERFKREAQAAGSIESENIASIVDFGHAADGVPYIVMEFLIGEDLAKFLAREGPLPVVRAVNIIIQACRGLDAAHASGIIHRDLKPENLFLCRRGDGSDLVKILDFGIAKLAQASVEGPLASVTRTGSTMGTPFYMSPEQARGAKDVDHRADVYGLGVILFEALSGQKPHPGDSYNAILYHILTQPPIPIATLRLGLAEDLMDALHRSLAFDPAGRPATVMDFAQALAHHAGRQVTPLRSQFNLRVTRSSDSDSEPSSVPSYARIAPTPAPARQSRPRWLVAGLALILAGIAAAFLLRQRDHESSRGSLHVDQAADFPPSSKSSRAAEGAPLPASETSPAHSPPASPAVPESAVLPPSESVMVTPKVSGDGHTRRSNRLQVVGSKPAPSRRPVFDPRNPYQ